MWRVVSCCTEHGCHHAAHPKPWAQQGRGARCWRPAGVLCLLRGCEVLPRLARCQPRASAQWQGLEDLTALSLWAQGLLVGQTAPLLSASGLRQEQVV